MQRYADIDRGSGVYGFEIYAQSIEVWFKSTGNPYTYSYQKAGVHHVEEMKKLALAGDGLNEYINNHTRKLYD